MPVSVCQWLVERVLLKQNMAYLNQVLAFGLGNQRLKFRGSKGVDKASFGDDQEKNLSASQDREFIGLYNSRMVS
jgi:hypothetical protein